MRARARVIFSFAAFALVLVALGAGITREERAFVTRGYEDPTRNAEMPYRQALLGANLRWLELPNAARAAQYEPLLGTNIRWLRQEISWSAIEKQPGAYDWSTTDALRTFSQDRRLRLVVWLKDAPPDLSGEDLPRAFADFAGEFAKRYGEIVHHYQLGERPPSPHRYATWLEAVYTAIHLADAEASVITAPLRVPDDLGYLRELYALGAQKHWDAIAIQGAFHGNANDRRVDPSIKNLSQLVLFREEMLVHGDGRRALWLTDFSWHNAENVPTHRQILATIERASREWPWLGALILPLGALEDEELLSVLRETDYTLPQNGLYSMRHEAVNYQGEWTVTDDGADYGVADKSEFTFPFYGSQLALLLQEDAWHTTLYARIDGTAANALPRTSDERGYVILTSPDRRPKRGLQILAKSMPLGEHELQVIGGGGDARFPLLGIAVSSGALGADYDHQLTLAHWSLALTLLGTLWSAWPLIKPRWRGFAAFRAVLLRTKPADGQERNEALHHRRAALSYLLAALFYTILQAQIALPLTLLALALLFLLILWRRELGLALILLSLPFFGHPIELARFRFPPAEIILLLTLVAELRSIPTHWRQSGAALLGFRYRALDAAVLLWVFMGTITMLWARWSEPALTEWRTLILAPALFYALVRGHAQEAPIRLRLVMALLAGASTVAALGISQFISGNLFVSAEAGSRRLLSVYGSPNNAALYLSRCLPFALALYWGASGKRIRQLAAFIATLLFAATLLTQSIAALFLGLPAAVLVALSKERRARWFALALMAAILLTALLGGRLGAWWNDAGGSRFIRQNVWQSALEMLSDEPLRGFGLDQFLYAYRDTYINPEAWRDPDLSHPHNFLLDVWLRLSLAGLLLFFALQWLFWRRIWPRIRAVDTNQRLPTIFALGAAGAMANLLAHGLVDQSIFVHDLAHLFAFLLSLAANDSWSQNPTTDL